MSKNIQNEILKYIDSFGTKFTFYTEKNRKFYTPLGGILTLLSIIFGVIVFIHINIDDFLHNNPSSTTSIVKENYRNIKFKEEKIWIPWRIRDYRGKKVDHIGLLYPIIYYYKGVKRDPKEGMDLSFSILDYRLCNETSMKNYSDSYFIDIDLDQIYCIDMDDLNMGGSWDTDYINYVKFDLYACKNGINYDENNENCSSYENISEIASENNSYEFELYYPVVHYQPMNKKIPIFVRYSSYFYHLSRFSQKIDRIYLQQHILKDDKGWFIKKEKYNSYWGYTSLNGDSYANGNKKDLMTEGSSSRFYSFNIYLKPEIVYYNRKYKKFLLIIADGLPVVSVLFTFFKLIAKIFKVSAGNQKLTELLFENLQEKKPKISNGKVNILKLKNKKNKADKKNNSIKKTDNNTSKLDKNFNINNLIGNTTNNNINEYMNDYSSIQLNNNNQGLEPIDDRKYSFGSKINKFKLIKKRNDSKSDYNRAMLTKSVINNNYNLNYGHMRFNNNNININIHNKIGEFPHYKVNFKKRNSLQERKNIGISKILSSNYNYNYNKLNSKKYVQNKLFPYKYYLCSIFIKNIDLRKKPFFFTKKFISVYNFVCQLFDISSYLIMQKEFQIMKDTIMIGKYRDILENKTKINVNDNSFNTDMKECLDSHKFSILGRIKQSKEGHNSVSVI